MFSLGSTIREINNDRHRKYTPLLQKPPSPQLITNKKPLTKDVSTQTYQSQVGLVQMISVSCDTKELEQKEKEKKALLAFRKRIEDQKVKAQQMKQFLGTTKSTEEDELDDE